MKKPSKRLFVTPLGKYEYLKVPFGLAQAPAYFQNLMNKLVQRLNFTLAYLDDIIIFSETPEQHLKHIQIVLTRLKQAKLSLKKSKCSYFQERTSLSWTLTHHRWYQTSNRKNKSDF